MQTVADIEGPLKQRIAKLERENAKLREACEVAKGVIATIRYHSNFPDHKRMDPEFLRACCVIAVEQADSVLEKLRAALAREGERE
jgi:hypothetical protein